MASHHRFDGRDEDDEQWMARQRAAAAHPWPFRLWSRRTVRTVAAASAGLTVVSGLLWIAKDAAGLPFRPMPVTGQAVAGAVDLALGVTDASSSIQRDATSGRAGRTGDARSPSPGRTAYGPTPGPRTGNAGGHLHQPVRPTTPGGGHPSSTDRELPAIGVVPVVNAVGSELDHLDTEVLESLGGVGLYRSVNAGSASLAITP